MAYISPPKDEPHFESVAAYLLDVAKDVATLVDDKPAALERFRQQIRVYAEMWRLWMEAEAAAREKRWTPAIGRPEAPRVLFSRTYNNPYDPEKEAKQLAGSYSLLAFLYDREVSHLEKINNGIVTSEEIISETLDAPRNALDGRMETPDSEGPDLREGCLFDEHLNAVEIDLREFLGDGDSKDEQAAAGPEQNVKDMPDADLLQRLSRTFEPDSLLPMLKEKTWLSVDRTLAPLFKEAIRRLKAQGKKKAGVLEYEYQNLLHYARGMQTRKHRCSRDSFFQGKVWEYARELADSFERLALEADREAEGQGLLRRTDRERMARLIRGTARAALARRRAP